MASPLNVKRNNYIDNPKKSDIYTPKWLSGYIYDIVKTSGIKTTTIFDPAIGMGSLTEPFRDSSFIIGCDINKHSRIVCDVFIEGKFEDTNDDWLKNFEHDALPMPKPDLIIVNPPFNSASGRKLYPEVFLKKIDDVFGREIPVIMIVPMGFLLNQRLKSKRWRYLRDNWKITSIIALPIDAFKKEDGSDVLFHAEIVCFNCKNFEPYYFLSESVIPVG